MTTPPQGQNPYGQAPYGQTPYGQGPYAQNPYPQAPSAPYGQPPQAPHAPYGQPPQAGYAYPPQQQAPYGQQPGFPQAPQQPQIPQGGAPVPPSRPARNGPSPMTILKGIGVVIVLIAGVVFWISSWNDADTAKAGDCMKNNGNDIKPDLEVVDCGSAEAKFKVEQVHNDTLDRSLCGPSGISYVESQHRRRGADTKFVLCLSRK